MSRKTPKNKTEELAYQQISDHCADRFRITFRAGTQSCFTKQEHLPSVSMNLDDGQVFGRGLMKTVVILSLHQVIPSDGRSSSR